MFTNYMSLLNSTTSSSLSSSPFFSSSTIQWHCILGCLLVTSSLLFVSICSIFKRIPVCKFVIIVILYTFVFFISSLPILTKFSTKTLNTGKQIFPTNSFKSRIIYDAENNVSPTWLYYVFIMLKSNCCGKSLYSSSVDCNSKSVCLSPSFYSSFTNGNNYYLSTIVSEFTCQHTMTLITYSCSLSCVYALLLLYCLYITETHKSFITSITEEIELYRLGPVEYIMFHWSRLDVPQILIYFWSFKVMSVIILGPLYWKIIPVSSGANLIDISAKLLNSSTLTDYSNQNTSDQSTLSVLITRLCVGLFVHGSETWLSVFGAAAFFSVLATMLVSLLVFLLDPSGDGTAQLAVAAADAPADPHAWNAIEDPALALDQNDVIAVELLAGTGWNCAAVFLFLAFQSDMPNLPPVYRASCCIYGIMVIVITCIHPVQALIKSFLLRLGIPGQETSWLAHVRPLCFCIVLVLVAFSIFTHIPKILTHERIEYNSRMNESENATFTVILSHLGSSEEAIRARQLRVFLSGCQLLLSIIVTLIEYSVYQYFRRFPDWTGFRPMLFWTKAISSVLDYIISLLSFLTVCWLLFYDSIGVCRLFIICCYLVFVLYPSAHRAYTWIRWRLSFKKQMNNLNSPTDDDLKVFGDTCPICYTQMTTQTAKITRCGHLYHTDCLVEWMKRQLFCPMCHADLLSTRVTNRRVTDHQQVEEDN
ncbi:unnamed protein product [Heterobilharzia americana]|nr:unnamed protein product [Heterobilharzia americana]